MAKAPIDRHGIEAQIAQLATQFAQSVVAVIGGATVEELLHIARRQGSPSRLPAPTAHPRATLLSVPGTIKRRRRWPTCGEPGCSSSYYPASGTSHLCYQHFLASGGRHPSKKR